MRTFIQDKLHRYGQCEKNFQTLFSFMFSERENVMAERLEAFRIKKITYGECADEIYQIIPALQNALSFAPQGHMVGIYMNNSLEWIEIFWSILACGFKPLLMNMRLDDGILENILNQYGVVAVVSDGKTFSVPTLFAKDIIANKEQKDVQTQWEDEIVFMSSGTSENVKLCIYTGENLYYQICDSANIVKTCPMIGKHYEGELKQLALLPFYHVFGFIAVYIWFGFFSRTFVFLKDMQPQTLLNAVKLHKVTHIFAVPLVWDTVYKEAMRKIRMRGEKTYNKFCKGLHIANKTGAFGRKCMRSAFKEIRDNLFGESIRFCISGGSQIQSETLAFFNGIGYHIVNGYGMTEVGITSVEISKRQNICNSASIGAPFGYTHYRIDEQGELWIKGKTRAAKIIQNGQEYVTDYENWFPSRDLAQQENGRYYLRGRKDDLIVCENGENLNPVLAENSLSIKGDIPLCLFTGKDGQPVLLISAKHCLSTEKLQALHQDVVNALQKAKLSDVVKKIVITADSLLESNDFKISRKKIAKRYAEGKFTVIDPQNANVQINEKLSQLEKTVRSCFAEALSKSPEEIALDANFFLDLGGTSLDYFVLLDVIKTQCNAELPISDGKRFLTVREICQYLQEQ